jgi:hypothetical protein
VADRPPAAAESRPVVIQPALFRYVTEAAADISAKPSSVTDELRGTDKLVFFLENFVAQFSANVLGKRIQGLNVTSLEEWVNQRRLLQESSDTGPAQQLMYAFEKAFTLVAELSYGGSDDDLGNFRSVYVPEVLARITAWVSALPVADEPLLEAARQAEETYRRAVAP